MIEDNFDPRGFTVEESDSTAASIYPAFRFNALEVTVFGEFFIFGNGIQLVATNSNSVLTTLVAPLPRWWRINQATSKGVTVRAFSPSLLASPRPQPGAAGTSPLLTPILDRFVNVCPSNGLPISLRTAGTTAAPTLSPRSPRALFAHPARPSGAGGGWGSVHKLIKPTNVAAAQGLSSLTTIGTAATHYFCVDFKPAPQDYVDAGVGDNACTKVPVYLYFRTTEGTVTNVDYYIGDLNRGSTYFAIIVENVTSFGYYVVASEGWTTAAANPYFGLAISGYPIQSGDGYAVPGSSLLAPTGALGAATIGGGGGDAIATGFNTGGATLNPGP